MKRLLNFAIACLMSVGIHAQYVKLNDHPGYVGLKQWNRPDSVDVELHNPVRLKDGTKWKFYGLFGSAFKGTNVQSVWFYQKDFEGEEIRLGDGCFAECRNLTLVVLPSNIKRLPYGCFENDKALEHFQLPDEIEVIEDHVFAKCDRLREISITNPNPKKLRNGGDLLFQGVLTVPKGHGDFYVNPRNGWLKYFPHVREEGSKEDYVSKNPKVLAASKPYAEVSGLSIDEGAKAWTSNLYRGLTVVIEHLTVGNLPTDDVWVKIHWYDAAGKPLEAVEYSYRDSKGNCQASSRFYTNYNDPARFSNVHIQQPYNAVWKGYGPKTFKYQVTISGMKTGVLWKSSMKTITITNRPRPRR